jgi:hypothetical protein
VSNLVSTCVSRVSRQPDRDHRALATPSHGRSAPVDSRRPTRPDCSCACWNAGSVPWRRSISASTASARRVHSRGLSPRSASPVSSSSRPASACLVRRRAEDAETPGGAEGVVGERQPLRHRDHRGQAEQPPAGPDRGHHRLGADRPEPPLGRQPAGRAAHARPVVEQPGPRTQVQPVGQPAQRPLAAAPPAAGGDRVPGTERPHGLLGPAGDGVELRLHRVALERTHAASLT